MSASPTITPTDLARRFDDFRATFKLLTTEIHRAVVGYEDLIQCFACTETFSESQQTF